MSEPNSSVHGGSVSTFNPFKQSVVSMQSSSASTLKKKKFKVLSLNNRKIITEIDAEDDRLVR